MMAHSIIAKSHYYLQRVRNEDLTPGQRSYARQRSLELYREYLTENNRVIVTPDGPRAAMVYTITEWVQIINERRLSFNRTPTRTIEKQMELDRLDRLETSIRKLQNLYGHHKQTTIMIVGTAND